MKSRRPGFSTGLTLLVVALSPAFGGCQSSPDWAKKMAFWKQDDVDPRGTLSPKLQMEAMQTMRAELPSLPPADQQAKAAELAQRYRNESDPILRAQVVRTIAVCGSPVAAETLFAALNDSERDVRRAACEGWGDHGGPQAAPTLGQVLRTDKSMDVRLAAARALGKIGGPEAVPLLAPALDDPDPALQYRAVQSLRQASGKDFGDSVTAWRDFIRGGAPKEISTAQRMKLDYF